MIKISKQIERQIRFVGEKSYPNEGGGMLLGVKRDGITYVKESHELPNSAELYRNQRYYLTPHQYRQAEKVAKNKNLELIGFFHSHPNSPASPSHYDVVHALPVFIYIIISVHGGRSSGMTGWSMLESRERFEQKRVESVL